MPWLRNEEWRHVALTSRLKAAGGAALFGQIADGRLWIRYNERRIAGALYLSRSGVVLPAFDRETGDTGDIDFLRNLLDSRRDRIFSVIGMENRVLDIEGRLGDTVPDVENYRMFTGIGPPRGPEKSPPGLSIHRASASDCDRLWPLEKAYQIEEVLRKGSCIDEQSSRRFFLNTLINQDIYYAEIGGRPVAKAGTNARGWTVDQIGGVYVIPELRGYGFARAVMNRLLSEIYSLGRQPCLFVKNSNRPALSLYEKLDFLDRGPFRISYWS